MNEKHPSKKDFAIRCATFFIMILVLKCFLSLGHLLSIQIYKLTGEPPKALSFIVAGFLGMLLCGIFFFCIDRFRKHMHKEASQRTLYDQLIGALEEISRGNFNIDLSPNKHDPFREILDAVNNMARNLGTLETMRSDFISNVSHEIQSPLTSIGGFAALLKSDALSPEERRHYAEIIETESRRLSCLSDNLLKISALDSEKNPLKLHTFSIDRQLQNVALTLEPQWSEKNLNIEVSLMKCDYFGDEDLLSQVWMNLLHNAIKFTPEGGDVCISLTTSEDAVSISISDTGLGIAPEDRLRIFERFYKADKSRDRALGGTGLGLSLVKKIVDLHGGRIDVDSDPGKSTVFKISLPHLHSV